MKPCKQNAYYKILQIKLAQWSLIKIIFPLEGSFTLASIYVRSAAVLKSFLDTNNAWQ